MNSSSRPENISPWATTATTAPTAVTGASSIAKRSWAAHSSFIGPSTPTATITPNPRSASAFSPFLTPSATSPPALAGAACSTLSINLSPSRPPLCKGGDCSALLGYSNARITLAPVPATHNFSRPCFFPATFEKLQPHASPSHIRKMDRRCCDLAGPCATGTPVPPPDQPHARLPPHPPRTIFRAARRSSQFFHGYSSLPPGGRRRRQHRRKSLLRPRILSA